MLCWDASALAARRSAGPGRRPQRSPRAAAPPPEWSTWRQQLWRELGLGALPFIAAHLMFATGQVNLTGEDTLSMSLAQVLFGIGALLLWRVTRMLHLPVASTYVDGPGQAGLCLALTVALSLSPWVWWLLSMLI